MDTQDTTKDSLDNKLAIMIIEREIARIDFHNFDMQYLVDYFKSINDEMNNVSIQAIRTIYKNNRDKRELVAELKVRKEHQELSNNSKAAESKESALIRESRVELSYAKHELAEKLKNIDLDKEISSSVIAVEKQISTWRYEFTRIAQIINLIKVLK